MTAPTLGNEPPPTKNRGPVVPTLLVVGIVALSALIFAAPMYVVGARAEGTPTFLRNYRAPNEFEAFTSYCMDYALGSPEPNDVVFLGDSSARCDIQTAQFEKATHLKAYNLGSVGLIGIDGYLHIFRAYLEHHSSPRLAVLCMLPSSLGRSPTDFGPPEAKEVRSRFLQVFGSVAPESSSPLDGLVSHARQGVRTVYGRLLGGFDHFAQEPIPFRDGETYTSLKRAVTFERGFWPVPPGHAFTPRANAVAAPPFSATVDFMNGLAALDQLAAKHGTTVLLRFTPSPHQGDGDLALVRAWASDVESRFPHILVSRPELLKYEPALFADESHCNRSGVDTFTAFLANEVTRVLANLKRPTIQATP